MIIITAKEKNMLEIMNETFRGDIFNKCCGFPDRKSFKETRFIFINTSANIEYALKTFPEAQWLYSAKDKLEEYYEFKEQEEINRKAIKIKSEDYEECTDYSFKTKPYAHQLKAFQISKNLKSYALLFEQGCGKTKVILDTAQYLFNRKEIECLITIAPNGVHRDWINEALPFHLENVNIDSVFWSSGLTKKERKQFDFIKNSKKLKIFSFNIESFVSKKAQDELIDILNKYPCLLCIDESQTIKNPSAKRTKFMLAIKDLAKYRRILTGTPITNGAQNFYTQFKFLDQNIIGINSYYAFRNRYCIMGGWENKQIIAYKNIEELQSKIQSHSMRVLKSECFDLPPKTWQRAYFDLTAEQRKYYKEVCNDGILFLKNNPQPTVIETMVTRLIKMQQIMSGFYHDTEKDKDIDIIPFDKNPRILKLKEVLSQIEGKIIIWARFTRDIENILKLIGKDGVRYDGKISTDEKEQNKIAFKTKPEIKYFVANPQAGARGLNLAEATTAIYYSNSYNLEERLQSEDRCHRIGTTKNVNYIDIQANRTIDRKIINALRSKKKISDLFLQDPMTMFLEE